MSTGDSTQRGSRIMLESPTEFLSSSPRIENGAGRAAFGRFTPDCDVDAGNMPIVVAHGVKPDDSIAWLASLATRFARHRPGGPGSRRGNRWWAPWRFTTRRPPIARSKFRRAQHGLSGSAATPPSGLAPPEATPARACSRGMIADDPSDKVREQVTFGLSVSSEPAALTTLINTARNDQEPRRSAARRSSGSRSAAGKEAFATIAGAIDTDPDTEVKKKAVFALSQMPQDEGVPKLIEVARSNRNPEVRKQAMFWLGQSHDARAVKFFEDILLKK